MNTRELIQVVLRVMTDSRVIFIAAAVLLYWALVMSVGTIRKIKFKIPKLQFPKKAPKKPEEPPQGEEERAESEGKARK
jgi:hypothetical protein